MGYQKRYDNRPRSNPETDKGMNQRKGLIILQKTKDLMQYLYTSCVKYPKSEKHGFVADYKKKRMICRIKFNQKIFEVGMIAFEKLNNTMQSYFGLMEHFTAGNLLRKIIDEFSFRMFHDNNNS